MEFSTANPQTTKSFFTDYVRITHQAFARADSLAGAEKQINFSGILKTIF
jgi:hypothetical protein